MAGADLNEAFLVGSNLFPEMPSLLLMVIGVNMGKLQVQTPSQAPALRAKMASCSSTSDSNEY